MSIIRKWPTARAELFDEDGVAWIAEARAGTGVWVIREDSSVLRGGMFEFQNESSIMLTMTTEQRAELGMSDALYQEINIALRLSQTRGGQ